MGWRFRGKMLPWGTYVAGRWSRLIIKPRKVPMFSRFDVAQNNTTVAGRPLVIPRQLVTDDELYPDWVQAFMDRVIVRRPRGRFEMPRLQISTGIVVNIKFCGLQRRIHVPCHLHKLLGGSLIFVPLHELVSSPSPEASHLTNVSNLTRFQLSSYSAATAGSAEAV